MSSLFKLSADILSKKEANADTELKPPPMKRERSFFGQGAGRRTSLSSATSSSSSVNQSLSSLNTSAMKEKMRNSLLRNGSSPLLSESVDSSEPGSSLKETLSVRNIDLNSSNALSSSMNPISEKAAKIAHVAPTYTPCSSKKVIGSLYLPASEIMLVKTSLCEPLFITLDIKEFHVSGDGSPAPDGFSWEQMQEDPIMEQLNGKEGIKLATVPSIAYNLASSGFTTDHSFLSDFLRTYRYFANSVDISRLLIMVYIQAKDIAFAKADSEEVKNMKMNVDDMATHIKLRILNIFKKWLSDQPQDFEEEPLICGILTSFLSTHVSFDPKRAPFAQTMMEQLATITASSPIMNRTLTILTLSFRQRVRRPVST